MRYAYYLYKLSSGHTILTPKGKTITKEEFSEYFDIVCKWLKDVRPNLFNDINPQKDSRRYGEMLNEMFEAYQYDPIEGGVQERYFSDLRTLAFLFVVSYYIQKENEKVLSPQLTHVMGNALLEWLPISKLVEYYLSLSANPDYGSNTSDGYTLFRMFNQDRFFTLKGFEKNDEKAFKYAEMNYTNPLNRHDCNNSDLAYAKMLFKKDKYLYIDDVLRIINEKLENYNLEDENDQCVLRHYFIFQLEVSSKIKNANIDIDLDYAEDYLLNKVGYSLFKSEGLYWLAQCYISGLNNSKNVEKAKELLLKINDPYMYKRAGASLAKIYLDAFDYEQALTVATIADYQGTRHCLGDPLSEKELDEALQKATQKAIEARYVRLMRRILQEPIHSVNIQGIDTWLKINLEENEYDFLMNEYDFDDDSQRDVFVAIINKLRNPAIIRRLNKECNKMIYIGTNEKDEDRYLSFEQAGNIFIHGWPGSGKTWYFNAAYRRLKEKECYKPLGIAFWSFKPFEYENWCHDELVEEANGFIKTIKCLLIAEKAQKVIFIDELTLLLKGLSQEDKKWLIDLMRHSKENNICFICSSQNMAYFMDEFDELATTKICMGFSKKEEDSKKMIGSDKATTIEKYGEMYVLNQSLSPLAMKLHVVRKR